MKKESKNENEVAVKPTTALAMGAEDTADWGADEISNSDVLIPKILLMQGLSRFVSAEKAAMGDFVNSVSGEVLGSKSKPIEFVPIRPFKTWIRFEELAPGKWEYRGQEPMTAANEHWELEGEENGVKFRRDRAINFYVVLAQDVGLPDAMPYLISCRRTSYMAGKKLGSHFKVAKMAGIAPAKTVFTLECRKEQNDKGTFYVLDIVKKRPATPEEFAKAVEWNGILRQGAARVDDSDLREGSGTVDVSVDVNVAGAVNEASQF